MAVERDEICQRDGYQKILQSCEQAQKDGYEWLWVDTCCINKQSSAELHDVPDPWFPTRSDDERYQNFNGWPEWFSRGWTLQELGRHHWSSGAYIDTWTLWKPSVCCSNHVVGSLSDDNASGGQSLFAYGSAGREYTDVVWRGEEGISPSSAGDHPRIERPKHLCMELQRRQYADRQYPCG
ncbi:hypothetical protein SCLCIDRAFT_1213424 [Scleroderma citrinum Foug A]|uniref:Heterokaryon incompatibility domain-containing protein n=1 Tax=Scleroderma citrinum Foug A TaxID=1036808 RepID=A0A0C3DUN3_9AGAM|nr:hypothetical protein SCLCIDRAFT_1213424 [Scleroderma citrinum Foug A]